MPMKKSLGLLSSWRPKLITLVSNNDEGDRAHDLNHLERVWGNALQILSSAPGANHLVVMAACYLHDIVNLPKSHPNRKNASCLSAARAKVELAMAGFPAEHLDAVAHAIEAHSFSAGISPETYEAEIVQDADRLDALGAVGLARMFHVGGQLGRCLAHGADPLGKDRSLDDMRYTLDHIENKLLRLPGTMKTPQARRLAQGRAEVLIRFRDQFVAEWMGM
ncbi:HD domain-containing protein [Bordetella tumbae]